MSENSIQQQIDEINRKMDLVLDHLNQQRLKSDMVEDLVADLSIVGTDAYKTAVAELENQNISINADDVKHLLFKLIKNVNSFTELMEYMESGLDLLKDLGPVAKDATIELIHYLHRLEMEGYFDYIRELSLLIASIKNSFTAEDVRSLSANMEIIGSIFRNLTDPRVLKSAEKITHLLSTMEIDDKVDDKSLFKLMRELSKPEVRKTLSFAVRVAGEVGKKNN